MLKILFTNPPIRGIVVNSDKRPNEQRRVGQGGFHYTEHKKQERRQEHVVQEEIYGYGHFGK